ncbi:MAG: hypothetical protein M1821_002185 [Bathelium mastoideum]|nr:MAG: hypothetical protein M1821_002185 [Bathelium mastoideum]
MALQAPQHQRQLPYAGPSQQHEPTSLLTTQPKRPLEDSQEWVLFSPTGAPSTAQTHTTSTERTPKTAGRSRISDFGSLDTAARSQDEEEDDDITCQGTELDEEDNEELDSLDDGLHAFHEPPESSGPGQRPYQSGSILPTHDGLGGFRASASPVQEQLWHYERYNPRRRHARRRSSVQKKLDALEAVDELHHDNENNQRIEKWRMEQSKALLEEVERETRRQRRMSRQSTTRSPVELVAEDQASMGGPSMEEVLTRPDPGSKPIPQVENESIWRRFTRHFIHDLMGIDEDLLSVLFGESLPVDAMPAQNDTAPENKDTSRDLAAPSADFREQRLFQRIARELGILIYHISEHPGAFSTYLRTQETPDYAGLSGSRISEHNIAPAVSTTDANTASISNPAAVTFAPTLQQTNHTTDASLWGIETDARDDPFDVTRSKPLPNIAEEPSHVTTTATAAAMQEREYWERELDIKMVFNYLRNRFSASRTLPPSSPEASSTGQPRRDSGFDGYAATTVDLSTSPGSRKRAALIRRHHPLTARSAAAERTGGTGAARRVDLLHRHHLHHHNHGHNHGGLAGLSTLKRPGSSSCASQSTRSKKSLSRHSGSSSRNYWDLGGSVGSAGFGSDAGIA